MYTFEDYNINGRSQLSTFNLFVQSALRVEGSRPPYLFIEMLVACKICYYGTIIVFIKCYNTSIWFLI